MSTIGRGQRVAVPPLLAGDRLDRPTFHERYEAMPPGTRAELIGGVVVMPSPVGNGHSERSGNLIGWLWFYSHSMPGLRVGDNGTVMLNETGEVQPDTFLRIVEEYGGRSRIEDPYVRGAPELVVEVAASSKPTDLGQKLEDYRRDGVLEYLVVALEPDEIHWFVRRGDELVPMPPGPDGVFRSEVFPGLWLDPEALFANDLPRLIAILERGKATPEHAAFVAALAERRH